MTSNNDLKVLLIPDRFRSSGEKTEARKPLSNDGEPGNAAEEQEDGR